MVKFICDKCKDEIECHGGDSRYQIRMGVNTDNGFKTWRAHDLCIPCAKEVLEHLQETFELFKDE